MGRLIIYSLNKFYIHSFLDVKEIPQKSYLVVLSIKTIQFFLIFQNDFSLNALKIVF